MPLLDHTRNNSLGAYIGGNEVDIHNTAEILHIHLLHGDTLDYAGIINKYVDCADSSFDIGDHRFNGCLIGHIAKIAFCINAQFLIRFHATVNGLLTRAVKYDFRTSLSKSLCYCETYSVGSTCNKGNFAFQ